MVLLLVLLLVLLRVILVDDAANMDTLSLSPSAPPQQNAQNHLASLRDCP